MSRINSICMVSDEKLSKRYDILYGLNFMEDVLEQPRSLCFVSDDTMLDHFGLDYDELAHKLFYRYGYELDMEERTPLYEALAAIEQNLKAPTPRNLHSFWVIPNRFCIVHTPFKESQFSASRYILRAARPFDALIDINGHFFPTERFTQKRFIINSIEVNLFRLPFRHLIERPDVDMVVKRIDELLAAGKKVLLHAPVDTERVALILACWLVKHKLADETNFIDKIERLREGFWIEPPSGDPREIELNRIFKYNCDDTRHYTPYSRCDKIRNRKVIPFHFSEEESAKPPFFALRPYGLPRKVDPGKFAIIKSYL